MKIQGIRRRHAGFSLMELVVVVAIIAVLAALTLGAFNFINQKSARTKAKVQVSLLANAIQDYHADNRSYPVSTDANGERGDEVLYKALYWEGYEGRDSGGKIYLGELDPLNNTKAGQGWILGKDAQARIIDPWANPYRYRTGDQAVNVDFDLWSMGPDGKTNPDAKHKDSLDDIKSW
ncbi:type II secretion system protein GspG [Luteolibacter arcticus]|uniref:Type II secretion system protein GspG n=1 Tax=Luteolibacter arcticus TaxID=1581411 RepID=A0ABT3GJW1_9BACT|nr:type II secretion system protein GspG [Luteolibacter arcticus]MCW1923809.1 type II secretion system protein GspG [Luteolibacter arcticus]